MELKNIQNNNIKKASNASNEKKYIPKPYLDTAKNIEKQFSQHMIEQMEKTINRNSDDSTSTSYYRSLLNSEYSEKLANSDTLKIQKLILDQIYPKRFRTKQNYENYKNIQEQKNNKGKAL